MLEQVISIVGSYDETKLLLMSLLIIAVFPAAAQPSIATLKQEIS
jgi:hypothetical protein